MSGTPSRGNPAMFNAGLFASPSPSDNTSSDLASLGGFGDDFLSDKLTSNSPFSLAPAKPVQTNVSPESSTTSKGSSDKTLTPASNLFSSLPPSSSASDDSFNESLSSVPLLTPPPQSSHQSYSEQQQHTTQSTFVTPSDSGFGTPLISSFQSLSTSTTNPVITGPSSVGAPPVPMANPLQTYQMAADTESYQVQPLVNDRAVNPSLSSVPSQHGGDYTATQSYGQLPSTDYSQPQYLQNPPPSNYQMPYDSQSYNTSTTGTAQPGNTAHQPSVAPVQPHWFYLRTGGKYWYPFNVLESSKLNEEYLRSLADPSYNPIVQTDGGRYDVDVRSRIRTSVYWEEPPSQVRRCTWFYRGEDDQWYIPYEEGIAQKLEDSYCSVCVYGQWNTKVDIGDGDGVIIHSPTSIVHYPAQHFQQPLNHEFDYSVKAVLRGFLERDKVNYGDDRVIDHVVFVVKGLESYTELSNVESRSLVDDIDDFREVAMLMLQTHKFSGEMKTNRRVEFLPVHWCNSVQETKVTVDGKIQTITLPSISRLRDFTNCTFNDILFYASPLHKQVILNQVALEMNHMLEIFKHRNPGFSGSVSVMGHGLGSVILFDLLHNQMNDESSGPNTDQSNISTKGDNTAAPEESVEQETEKEPDLSDVLAQLGLESCIETFNKEQMDLDALCMCSNEDLKDIGLPLGPRKKLSGFVANWNQQKEEKKANQQQEQEVKTEPTEQGVHNFTYIETTSGIGLPHISYPKLNFSPSSLFALGSPIGLYLAISGVKNLDHEYHLPMCPSFYNVFHPYDPLAYRIEPLIVDMAPSKPVLMPHHKGRKRFHLELYENLERVGTSVKHHIVEGMRNMWNQLNELARAHTMPSAEDSAKEEEITQSDLISQVSDDVQVSVGSLNGGRRVDYVLQEAPIEKLNDYLFALRSHVSYWRSEDTAYFLLKQIYG